MNEYTECAVCNPGFVFVKDKCVKC